MFLVMQMLCHTNCERLLSLRYAFRQAEEAILEGEVQFFQELAMELKVKKVQLNV